MSPASFWHCPADQKAWGLWVLDWHQVHNIWSKKKERAEKKTGKVEARSLWKQEFYNACWIVFQFNAKAHDIKWKLGPRCNKSNLNLNPPILALFLLNTPPPPPQLVFQPPLLIIIAQSLPWHHTSPLFWEEPLNRGLSACLVYLLYYGLYKCTLLAEP